MTTTTGLEWARRHRLRRRTWAVIPGERQGYSSSGGMK
jgi:hypothetical protein